MKGRIPTISDSGFFISRTFFSELVRAIGTGFRSMPTQRKLLMDISDWRVKIDEIDNKLLKLFNQRAGYALEIGKIKRERNEPVYNPAREDQIYEHVQQENPGPLSDQAIRRLFERIIDETRRLERELTEKEGK